MFNTRLKQRIAALELAQNQLKDEIARLRTELAEMKQTLSRVLGENHGLRLENDKLRIFAAPAIPVKRHVYPDYGTRDEASANKG